MNRLVIPTLSIISLILISGCIFQKENKDKIVFQKAMETLDDNYCDQIPSEVDLDKGSLMVKEIIKTDDGRLIVSFSKERCYRYIAESKNDTSICVKIPPHANIINVCILEVAKFNNNLEACNDFEGMDKQTYKDICYSDLAKIRNDSNLCDNIITNESILSKFTCLQQFKED